MPHRFLASGALLLFSACAGSGEGSGGGPRSPPPSVILVVGRVVDASGTPLGGVQLRIGTQTTTSDVSGRFVLGNVGVPYVLVAASAEQHLAVIYQGLTRADPTVLWRGSGAAPDRGGEVRGAVDGDTPSSTVGVFTLLGWSSPEARLQSSTLDGRYALPLRWSGAQETTGSVRVLQMRADADGLPIAFPGYGVHAGVTVGNGSTVSSIDVPLTPPALSSIHGRHTLPPGYSFLERAVSVDFDDGTIFSLGGDDGSSPEYSRVVPSGIDASIGITATASGEGTKVTVRQTGIAAASSDVSLDLPRGAPILGPPDGATGVDAQTDLSWRPFPGGIYTLHFSTPGPAPTIYLVTEATHAALPELAELPIPSGTAYRWSVLALGPFASVDEAAGPGLMTPPGNVLLQSLAESRIFVTP